MKKNPFFILVAVITALAAFFRLYQLNDYATFLGDQGRDAIVMKDIITFQDFTALGPITSVGSIYLGPFYYYFMAPWLGLFGLNPLGPAFGVAFISIVCVVLQYFAMKDLTNRATAAISIVFTSFSWVLIEYSRFSWNPNLLGPFSFFTVYTLIKAVQTGRTRWFALLGALLSAVIQLHYLGGFLIPVAMITVIGSWVTHKNRDRMKEAKNILIAIVMFVMVISPFLIFEVKHHFPNAVSALNFYRENGAKSQTSNPINEFTDTSSKLLLYSFQMKEPGTWVTLGMIAILFATPFFPYLKRSKKKDLQPNHAMAILSAATFALLVGTSMYHGPKYPHYLGGLYVLLYVQLSYLLHLAFNKKTRVAGIAIIGLLLATFIVLNVKHYIFLWQAEGPKQIDRARVVAEAIRDLQPELPYSLTSSPEAYADYPYRYFLEAWGLKPVPKAEDSDIVTKNLFVVCEKKCDPTKDSQWAIAHFSPKKLTDEKTVGGMYIYRLIK